MIRLLLPLAAAVLFLPLYLFFSGYVKRMYLCFKVPALWQRSDACAVLPGKKQRWILRIIALAPALLALNVLSMPGLALLHLAAFGVVCHGLYLLARNHLSPRLQRIHFSGVVPLVLAAAWLILGYANFHHVQAVHYTVETEKPLPENGITLALISDVHYGVSLTGDDFQAVCDEIGAYRPDAVLLCGDLVDNATPVGGAEEMFSMLSGIESSFGTFFAYGNHDRPYRAADPGASEFHEALTQSGITLLQDDCIPLGDHVLLCGREDASRPRMTARELLKDADRDRFMIVMDHQPSDYEALSSTPADLVLSGHTHGGQLFPLGLIMRIFHINDAVYGQYTLANGAQAVVSSGLAGWRFPLKTNAPAEYVIITIRNP